MRADLSQFEGWQNGLLDRNVAQALLSGCVVAMVPSEVESGAFCLACVRPAADTIVSLKRGPSPTILPLPHPPKTYTAQHSLPVDAITELLDQTSASNLTLKALHGFILARQKFVPHVRMRSVLDVIRKWEDGARGYLVRVFIC